MVVLNVPEWYANWRGMLDLDAVAYGVGGIQPFRPDELQQGQVGFAIRSDGKSLVGTRPGDWLSEWIVIGHETAFGDPIFASNEPPHAVFSAMHGEGFWEPKLVAPSIGAFASCLRAFQAFAAARSTPLEIDANPPTREQQAQFLTVIRSLTKSDQDALGFWAVQIELDLDAYDWLT